MKYHPIIACVLCTLLVGCAQATTPTPQSTELVARFEAPTLTPIPAEPAELENWQAIETALGNALYERVSRSDILCEWQNIGRAEGIVYVWVDCSGYSAGGGLYSDSLYAVIHLNANGSIDSVSTEDNTPGASSEEVLNALFPPEIQAVFNHVPYADEMAEHLRLRRENPEPPLIVLQATQTP